MGLLVNRLSEYRLGDVLAQMNIKSELSRVNEAPVLIGGPVQPERGFVLHAPPGDWESSYKISERLCVTTSRDVLAAEWREDGDLLELWITADTFMRHMNRVLVGTMLEVALGNRTVESFRALLDGAPRGATSWFAAPCGAESLWRRGPRLTALHRGFVGGRSLPADPGSALPPSRSVAGVKRSSSRAGRSARRAEFRASRVFACEAKPRAPHPVPRHERLMKRPSTDRTV